MPPGYSRHAGGLGVGSLLLFVYYLNALQEQFQSFLPGFTQPPKASAPMWTGSMPCWTRGRKIEDLPSAFCLARGARPMFKSRT